MLYNEKSAEKSGAESYKQVWVMKLCQDNTENYTFYAALMASMCVVCVLSPYKPVFLKCAGFSGEPGLHSGPLALKSGLTLRALSWRQWRQAAQLG